VTATNVDIGMFKPCTLISKVTSPSPPWRWALRPQRAAIRIQALPRDGLLLDVNSALTVDVGHAGG